MEGWGVSEKMIGRSSCYEGNYGHPAAPTLAISLITRVLEAGTHSSAHRANISPNPARS